MVFPVVMHRCESWTIEKDEHQRIDAFELQCWWRLLRVPWTAKRFQPVNPKGNQPWIFIGRTDAEAEAPILWPPDGKSQLIRKDPDAGKDWEQEEKRATEDEMVGWYHWLWTWVRKRCEMVMDREAWHAAVHGSQRVGHNWATEQQQ